MKNSHVISCFAYLFVVGCGPEIGVSPAHLTTTDLVLLAGYAEHIPFVTWKEINDYDSFLGNLQKLKLIGADGRERFKQDYWRNSYELKRILKDGRIDIHIISRGPKNMSANEAQDTITLEIFVTNGDRSEKKIVHKGKQIWPNR